MRKSSYHLYKIFGVNAELLIDHAWGCETCTIKEIKAYIPENTSISSGQVLSSPYPYDMARLVIHEMADALSLDLVDKKVLTNQIVLNIGYDIENVNKNFRGEVKADRYGRAVPKEAHGSINFEYTSSSKEIVKEVLELFDSIVNRKFTVRRMSVTANHLISETEYEKNCEYEQLDLFSDYETVQQEKILREKKLENERHIQEAVLEIKKRYGKNAVLKGMNLLDGATAKSRNKQIGGHKA